jgi:hypothetical protein
MTVRELNEEIVNYLVRNPQTAVTVAEAISARSDALGTEVLHAIRDMEAAGWLRRIDGYLYLQGGSEAA